MEINPIQNYYRMQNATNTTNTKKAVDEPVAPAADARVADTIDISSEASFKAELSKQVKTYAANNSEGVSSERIAALKQQYQGDACPLSGSDIASKIIAGIIGPSVKD